MCIRKGVFGTITPPENGNSAYENVHLWKSISTNRHENLEKLKKCLEYPHSILEREWIWILQTSNMYISELGYFNDIAHLTVVNSRRAFPTSRQKLPPKLRPKDTCSNVGIVQDMLVTCVKFEQVGRSIQGATDFTPPAFQTAFLYFKQ